MGEKFKIVTVKGHDYRIGKFSAREGSYIVLKVSGILAPVFGPLLGNLDTKDITSPEDIDLKKLDIGAMIAPLANVPEADFNYLQEKSLKVCDVKLQAGFMPVVNDNGSFALQELEDDGLAIMSLMVHALLFNMTSFFSGSPLEGLLGAIQGLS